jgi:hypothetical protein
VRNLTSPEWIIAKGLAFLLLGLLAAGVLLLEIRTLKAGILLVIAMWSFCRFYYFAFYVIEHYVDPTFKFSSLLSLGHYLCSRKRKER